MIYGVIADVHANLPALEAALAGMRRDGAEAVLFLGDVVGYGAEPNDCVERLVAGAIRAVRGNHDRLVGGGEETEGYDYAAPEVRVADLWNRRALAPGNLAAVRALPAGPLDAGEGILLCHGSPREEDEYVFDPWGAAECAAHLRRDHPGTVVCFCGHTHVAAAWDAAGRAAPAGLLRLGEGGPWLVNPGSVGQPRDGDPRAAYGLYDSLRRVYAPRRVEYDIEKAQRAIVAGGLPRRFADRLCCGR